MTEACATRPSGFVGLIRKLWAVRFLRFLVIGGINTAFGFSVYTVAILLGLHFAIAGLLSTVLGVLFNFKTSGKLVFDSHDNKLIFRFFAVYAVQYAFGVFVVWALVLAGLPKIAAGAVLLVPAAIFAFALQRKFVFTA